MLLALICVVFFTAFVILFFSAWFGRNGTVCIILGSNLGLLMCLLGNLVGFAPQLLSLLSFASFSEHCSLFQFDWGVRLDFVSLSFLSIILFITTCILFFSCSYMFFDPRFCFFISFLQFFMLFMLVLVLSDSLIQVFIGWEGVGVVSFLLINFWFLRLEANKGALKALVFNRIGDFGYVAFLVFVLVVFQTTNLSELPLIATSLVQFQTSLADGFFELVLCLLLLAVFGKSAQLLLYAWLPDAMEGPTPVSALLHSATMVTAGVYLCIRTFFVFVSVNAAWLYLICLVSGLTSIFCGLYAFSKFDIKKIIAFSTCSQLGLMLCAVSFGFISSAFFHLFVHAFFKALLFISSGVIIHSLADEQDVRKYGRVVSALPFFYFTLFLGSLNIMGVFFFAGFYSKETLLLGVVSSSFSVFLKSLVCLSSLCTILYSVRLFLYVTLNVPTTPRSLYNHTQPLDLFLLLTIFLLAVPSLVVGFVFADVFIGFGNYTEQYFNVIYNFLQIDFVPSTVGFLFFCLAVVVLFVAVALIGLSGPFFSILYFVYLFFFNAFREFYVQSVYYQTNSLFNFLFYRYVAKITERLLLDSCSFFGIISYARALTQKEAFFIKGNLHAFLYSIFFFVSVFFIAFLVVLYWSSHCSLSFFLFFVVLLLVHFSQPLSDR